MVLSDRSDRSPIAGENRHRRVHNHTPSRAMTGMVARCARSHPSAFGAFGAIHKIRGGGCGIRGIHGSKDWHRRKANDGGWSLGIENLYAPASAILILFRFLAYFPPGQETHPPRQEKWNPRNTLRTPNGYGFLTRPEDILRSIRGTRRLTSQLPS